MHPTRPTYEQLYDHAEELSQFVYAALPEGHWVQRNFKNCFGPDDFRPTYQMLRRALGSFDRLPEAERRRILNGWRPWPLPPTRQQLLHPAVEVPVARRVLVVEGSLVHEISHGQAWAALLDLAPVQVRILAGTPKLEALEVLARILGELARDYDGMADNDGVEERAAAIGPGRPVHLLSAAIVITLSVRRRDRRTRCPYCAQRFDVRTGTEALAGHLVQAHRAEIAAEAQAGFPHFPDPDPDPAPANAAPGHPEAGTELLRRKHEREQREAEIAELRGRRQPGEERGAV